MSTSYSIIVTVDDALSGKTDVSTAFFGMYPKFNKEKVKSVAAEIANSFPLENNHRRVEVDCIEKKEDGTSITFHNIVLDTPEFGKSKYKNEVDKIIDTINREAHNDV